MKPRKGKSTRSWVGVDLDGTLAYYTQWRGIKNIGKPIPKMVNFVKQLLQKGVTVKIFTARVANPRALPYIKKWLEKQGLGDLDVTNIKDMNLIRIYDDQCRQVERNTGRIIQDKYPTAIKTNKRNV